MAKDRGSPDKGKVKFKYVEFELEANDVTLQESLRNIATAIMRGNGTPQKQVSGKAAPQIAVVGDGGEPQADEAVEEQDIETVAAAASSTIPRVRRTLPTPKIINDVDFTGASKPLKDFCAKAKLDENTTITRRYLAIAYWYKHYGNTGQVTMDHIHTAFRHMKWSTPADAASPLRDLKQKNQWLNKGEGKGAYAINHIGENEIIEMIGDD